MTNAADQAPPDRPDRPDVAILGGGMAALAAAWRLTDTEYRGQVGQVTIYERGARLGGKAASVRGRHGRIEEHGLHVWLGYYDNAFRLIRECYSELDRANLAPHSPIKTWRDAFEPAPAIGLEEFHEDRWSTWTAAFPSNDRTPGDPIQADQPTGVIDIAAQAAKLLGSFVGSIGGVGPDLLAAAALAGTNEARRVIGLAANVVPAFGGIVEIVDSLAESLTGPVQANERTRRLWHLIDVFSAMLRGVAADDLTSRGLGSIDHLEFKDWIAMHGAHPSTCDGALVSGLYDLAFSHRGGDRGRKEFPAGLGLMLATKTFFDYRGALFWKMVAGMGEIVIAPLYQALVARGVRFEFFHRVDDLEPGLDGSIDRVYMGRQVRLADGLDRYDPLVDIDGLACFVPGYDPDQVQAGPGLVDHDLSAHDCEWADAEAITLERGRDYDELVLAIPPGMGRLITTRLAEQSPRWQNMVDRIETIGTQSLQVWLTRTEADLGWANAGATVTAFVDSFDTYASMTHLLEYEDWSELDHRPKTVAYFCSSMPLAEPGPARAAVRRDAIDYLDNHVGHYWPGAVGPDGFAWDLLAGADRPAGPNAIDSQYLRANVDPSDQYVQAMPGTNEARLRPGDSGFAHLHLAGDWTDSGLNAGCIEAAVLSGIEAANSILGLPRGSRTTGGYWQH